MITKQFQQSAKTMRMLGMLYEALSDLEKAREIYEELVVTNPADY